MLNKARTLLSDFANAVTLLGLIGSISLSGVLGIVGPVILQPVLELPASLRVVLGLCIFLVALAVLLAGLKIFLERGSRRKAVQDPSPQSSEYSLWQELKRVEVDNEELRAALRQREQEAEQMRDWIEVVTPFMERMQLRFILQAVHRFGNNLHKAQQPDVPAMEKWVSLTSALIRRYLDDEAANFFLVHDGDSSFAGRLHRLAQIFDKPVDAGGKLRSDFDADAIVEALEPYPSDWNHPSR